MKNKIRIGVIGLGMGRNHVQDFVRHPAVEIVALCDQDQNRLEQVAKEFCVPGKFCDAETMFKQVKLDAVSIATPNKFHAPLTLSALKHNLHVLCEKPMAMNTADAIKMNEAAKKARKKLMINFSFRFSPMSFALKKQVDAGNIGDIYFGRSVWHRRRGLPGFGGWFGNKELAGGGPLIDLGVHRLDLALWLMGYPEPKSVSGSTYNVIARERARLEKKHFSVEDLACGIIKFKNGATLILEASWALNIQGPEVMETTLCGTKGGLTQRNTDGLYTMGAEIYTEEGGDLFTKKLDKTTCVVPSSYHEFVNSILDDRAPLATGDQGIKVMKILDGIYRSAASGKEVIFK